MGQVGQGQRVLHIGWDRMGLGQGGVQIRWDRLRQWTGLCPAEQVHLSESGTTRPWIHALSRILDCVLATARETVKVPRPCSPILGQLDWFS